MTAKKDFSKVSELQGSASVFEELANPQEEAPEVAPREKKGPRAQEHIRATLWLSAEVWEQIEAYAYWNRTRRAYVIEAALREYLAKPERAKIVKRWKRENRKD